MATTELGEAAITLSLNMKPLSGALGRVQALLSRLARHASRIGGIISATLGGVSVGAAVKLAAEFENTQAAFETLLGSAAKGRRLMGELEQFAAKTPFEFPELSQNAKLLLAMGFAAEEVLPSLRTLGDAVSALGGGADLMNRLIIALGQMRAKGTVSADEMRQLAEAGIPAWEILAQAIGVSIPEAMKLAEQRMISASQAIPALLEGMAQRFGGATDQLSRRTQGLFSTLRDTVRFSLRDIGQAIIEELDLRGRMRGLIDALEQLRPRIAETARQIAQATNALIEWAVANREAIANTAKWAAGLAAATLVLPKVTAAVRMLTKALHELSQVRVTTRMADLLIDFIPTRGIGRAVKTAGGMVKALGGVFGALGRLATGRATGLGAALKNLVKAFAPLGVVIRPVLTLLGNLATLAIPAWAAAAAARMVILGESFGEAALAVGMFMARITGLRRLMEWLGLADRNFRLLNEGMEEAGKSADKLAKNAQKLREAQDPQEQIRLLRDRLDLLRERWKLELRLANLQDVRPGQDPNARFATANAIAREFRRTQALLQAVERKMNDVEEADPAGKMTSDWQGLGDAIQDAGDQAQKFLDRLNAFADSDLAGEIRSILTEQAQLLQQAAEQSASMPAVPAALFRLEKRIQITAGAGQKLADALSRVKTNLLDTFGDQFGQQVEEARQKIAALIEDLRSLSRFRLISPDLARSLIQSLQERLRRTPREIAERMFRDFVETDLEKRLREIEDRAKATIEAIRQSGMSPEEQAERIAQVQAEAQRQRQEAVETSQPEPRQAQFLGATEFFRQIQAVVAGGQDPQRQTAANTQKIASQLNEQTRNEQSMKALLDRAVIALNVIAQKVSTGTFAP